MSVCCPVFASNYLIDSLYFLAYFFQSFSRSVHEEIIVGSIQDLLKFAREVINNEASEFSDFAAFVYLILAQFFNLTQKKHITYLIDLCQEQFR